MQDNEQLLESKLTYHEFCDILTDGWLIAEDITDNYPTKEFRNKLFEYIENNVKDKFEL